MSESPRKTRPQPAESILAEACARNLPVELRQKESDDRTVARSRILAADDDLLLFDEPQRIGGTLHFSRGQQLEVYLLLRDRLYTFDTTVERGRCVVDLNARKQVTGMAVRRPEYVHDAQRRLTFRVSLACLDPIRVEVHECDQAPGDCAPLDAEHFRGTLVDISLGGAAVTIGGVQAAAFEIGQPLFIGFRLPHDDTRFELRADVRQVRSFQDDTVVRLGIRFHPWPTTHEFDHRQIVLQRFITEVQRRSLKRAG